MCAAPNLLFGQGGKPALDLVEPRSRGWREVNGKTRLTGSHIKLGATPAPLLGQHNEEVFTGLLGFDGERLAGLREAGVI